MNPHQERYVTVRGVTLWVAYNIVEYSKAYAVIERVEHMRSNITGLLSDEVISEIEVILEKGEDGE